MLLADGPLAGVTARAIFVIDCNGTVTYKELVSEITAEPDYSAAIQAANAVAAASTCCGGGHCS